MNSNATNPKVIKGNNEFTENIKGAESKFEYLGEVEFINGIYKVCQCYNDGNYTKSLIWRFSSSQCKSGFSIRSRTTSNSLIKCVYEFSNNYSKIKERKNSLGINGHPNTECARNWKSFVELVHCCPRIMLALSQVIESAEDSIA